MPLVLGSVIMASLTTAIELPLWVTMYSFITLCVGQAALYVVDATGAAERHLNFAGRYVDLASDISQTLAVPMRCRAPADVVVTKARNTFTALTRNAPYVAAIAVDPLKVSRFELPPFSKQSPYKGNDDEWQ